MPMQKNAVKKNYNTFFKKYLHLIQEKSTKSEILEKLSDYKVFIPFAFSYDKKNNKVVKKPLIKWKDKKELQKTPHLIKEIAQEYKAEKFRKGVGFNLENFNIVVIDIDDIEKFEKNFGSVENFLHIAKEDAFLIVKTLQKGYHIYLSRKAVEKILDLNKFSGKETLEKWSLGFELRFGDKLVICYPSTFKHNQQFFEYKVLHVNPDAYQKEHLEEKILITFFEELKNKKQQEEKERKLARETLIYKERREKELEKYDDLKDIIQEIKKRVSFKDLISEYFVKEYYGYEAYHCPFHPPDKNPSFFVKNWDGVEIAKDFHDDKAYDIIAFYKEYYKVDFKEALKDLKELAKLAGIEFEIKGKKDSSHSKKTEPTEIKTNNYRFKHLIQTEKAIYSSYFSSTKKTKKRYAMLKTEKELWEVEEREKIFVPENEYQTDKKLNYDVYVYDERPDPKNPDEKLYSYLIFNLTKQIGFFNIVDGIEYKDPLFQEEQKYTLTIETKKNETLQVENITRDGLHELLKQKFLIASHQKIKDALSSIIQSLSENKLIKTKHEITRPGIYYLEEKKDIVFSKIQPKNISKEELAEALEFLNSLITEHYSHIQEKFITVLKWFLIAPFTFVAKQANSTIKALYLYGASGAGKSTMCLLLANFWKDFYKPVERTGASIDTIARLGKALSNSTFPEIISEPQGAWTKEDIAEAIKNAITNKLVRNINIKSNYITIYGLANIVFTSNHFLPEEDGLFRRFVVISFSKTEKPKTTQADFYIVKREAEKLLPRIGNYLLYNFDKVKQKIINEKGEILINEKNFFEISTDFLKFLYEEAGLEFPEILTTHIETEISTEEFEEEKKLAVITALREIFLKEAIKFKSSSVDQSIPLKEKLIQLIKSQYFPFLIFKDWEGGKIFLLTGILKTLEKTSPTCRFSNLKLLAETLDYPYYKKRIRLGQKIQTLQVIEIALDEFLELLIPTSEYTSEDATLEVFGDVLTEEEIQTLLKKKSKII